MYLGSDCPNDLLPWPTAALFNSGSHQGTPPGQLMCPRCPGSSPQPGHLSQVEGSPARCAHTCGGLAATHGPGLAEGAAQRKVTAAGFPARRGALFAQKIFTPSLSCSDTWPPTGPSGSLAPAPAPPARTLYFPRALPPGVCSPFWFQRAPAKHTPWFRGRTQAPAGPAATCRLRAHPLP